MKHKYEVNINNVGQLNPIILEQMNKLCGGIYCNEGEHFGCHFGILLSFMSLTFFQFMERYN